jgi:FMN reductase
MGAEFRPLIVGIGGTTRTGSASEKALRAALAFAEKAGANTEIIAGPSLNLPMYAPDSAARAPEAERLISALRRTHGVILSSPGYHGSISGMLKNALDYIEDMREDAQPYLEGRAVGLIACASGWQATGSTLAALRSIVHALRGWPTPLGVAINSAGNVFDDAGAPADPGIAQQLRILAEQVVEFARMRSLHDDAKKSARRPRSKS